MATESVDDLLDEITSGPTPAQPATPAEKAPPTRAELLARLKEKKAASRQGRATKSNKYPSHPLTPIYYCDSPDCMTIMSVEEAKMCPVCKVYCYCSKKCQTTDWEMHKAMCGKTPDPENQTKLKLYKEALTASNLLFEKTKMGDYITVINEDSNHPSCMFATIAEKSNVLNYRVYLKNPLFTTSPFDTLGDLEKKVKAAMEIYPDKKIYVISVLLDRVKENANSEAIARFYIADSFGETLANPVGGKITVSTTKYSRKGR